MENKKAKNYNFPWPIIDIMGDVGGLPKHGAIVPVEEAKKLFEISKVRPEQIIIVTTENIRLKEENACLRKALEVYSNDKNWMANRIFDMESSFFTGPTIAQEALKNDG